MKPTTPATGAPQSFDDCLEAAIAELDAGETVAVRKGTSGRRGAGGDFDTPSVTLLEQDGMLRWVYQPTPRRGTRRRALRRGEPRVEGTPLRTIPIQDLPANQVLEAVALLDDRLTPKRGLRRWRDGVLTPLGKEKINAKRVLLLVHGTFSKSDMYADELSATPHGQQFLKDAAKAYDAILTFDHPTLAVSPWINALDLEAAMAQVSGRIDVVCHSRGGLVVGWWLRLAPRNVGNVVFVGSPLAGTTLASPAALRQALDHLATAAKGIAMASGLASTVFPFMTVVTGLAKTLGKALQLGADLPIADAAVVTVPGLASQSRVRNNAEITRLFASPWPTKPVFHVVSGNFRPQEIDAGWKFWRRLSNIGDQAKYGAVGLIFDGPNDLVVDTATMRGPVPGDTAGAGLPELARITVDKARVTHFPDSPTVHHTNYFRQVETVNAMRAMF